MGKAGNWSLASANDMSAKRYSIKEDPLGEKHPKKNCESTGTAVNNSSETICTHDSFLNFLPEWVSLSGIKQCCDDEVPLWWRLIWIGIITIGIGFSIFQIVTQIITYRQWPIRAKVEITSMENMDFPPIIICNFNPARKSILEKNNLTSLIPLYSRDAEHILEDLNVSQRSSDAEDSEEFKTRDWESLYKDFAHTLDDMLLHVSIMQISF